MTFEAKYSLYRMAYFGPNAWIASGEKILGQIMENIIL